MTVKSVFCGVLLMAACCSVTAAESAGKPNMKPKILADGCIRHDFTVHSAAMDRDIGTVVILPPAYEKQPDRRYPVVYGLHGMGAPFDTFANMPPFRAFMVDHPMILVCFDADRASFYVDARTKPASQFTTFFFGELIPYMGEHYRTTGQRAVTGFSMGGYGALHYMLARPGMFASVSGMSSAPFHMEAERNGRRNGYPGMLLGDPEKHEDLYRQVSVRKRLPAHIENEVQLPPILLTCGTDDHLQAVNREFVDFMAELNGRILKEYQAELAAIEDRLERRARKREISEKRMIDFTYVETSGGHNWPYWKKTGPDIARFHWQHFQAAAPSGDADKASGTD